MIKLTVLILSLSFGVLASEKCKSFEREGRDITIRKICADVDNKVLSSPRVVDRKRKSWDLNPGMTAMRRANRVCEVLDFKKAVSYTIAICNRNESVMDIRGNVALTAIDVKNKCYTKITCE